MAYSKSVRAIEKVKAFLDDMLNSADDIQWAAGFPAELSYWIREGIHASSYHKDYAKYAKLNDKYQIRQRRNKVVAELRASPIEVMREAMATMTVEAASDAMEIIGAAYQHKADKIHFPNAETPDVHLYNWCEANGYKIIKGEVGLTLTKESVGDLAWHP